ncbi:anoctamin-4-like isoform X1 [Mytilus trossulus]|uniref:anoctamin-4-like isoform X1 n=1 Tax=Mytilus trossulus TaxID=6551 RepID=UPI003007CD91
MEKIKRRVTNMKDKMSPKHKRTKDGFMKPKAKQPIKNVEGKAITRFDRVYRKLGNLLIPESKRIDIVLIHPDSKADDGSLSSKEKRKIQVREKLREIFENTLRDEGFIVEESVLKDKVYKKIHCPFKRLCIEAETTNLEMPLLGLVNPEDKPTNSCAKFVYDKFVTDKDTVDYISARFMVERIHLFDNHHDPSNFFRPAVRTLLVDHILINMNIREDVQKDDIMLLDDDVDEEDDWKTRTKKKTDTITLAIDKELQKLNFPYMKKIGVYTDKLILHEASEASKIYEEQRDGATHDDPEEAQEEKAPLPPAMDLDEDPRKILNDEWTKLFKFQPLTKIRNYFGEKIAFYFAWSGLLTTSLWVPMLLGLAIFIYGIVNSASSSTDSGSTSNNESTVTEILTVIKEACDNEATPYYAMIICVWGTLFLELWKRKTSTLAYEWDVDEFEATEPDRPEFYGTKAREDPVTGEEDWYYPMREQLKKFLLSGLTLIFMLCVVLASVLGVIVYRVFASVDYCPNISPQACVMVTTVVSSLLNTISILILSKLYDWLARKLTDWENHRTQTSYDDALIVKLFAFQFANNYASCFYIAFVRGRFGEDGIFGLGPKYNDKCEPNGNCMSELSFQILILIICKPLPKFFTDVVLPWLQRLWRKRPQCCCKRKVEGVQEKLTFVQKEALKPSLGDFTMGEYTEKIIQYGFLMLFAASLPIAPLIALFTNLIDIRVDAKRMLWWYRRPLAKIAQDIGTWYIILQFVNVCGVISNGFLIAFTSSWGQQYDVYTRLWIVVGFEHIVFALKFILAYLIPDVPAVVQLASRKNMHHMSIVMRKDREKLEEELTELINNPPQPESPYKELPNVYREKENDDEWQPVDEEQHQRSSPKQKRRHRVDEENAYEEIDNNDIRKLKKKKKKKKHHQQEDREDEDIEPPPYSEEPSYRSDPQYYTSRDQESSRPIYFKVKGPQGQVFTELPVSERTRHSSKHSAISSSHITVKGPRGEFIKELPMSTDRRYRLKHSDDSMA